MRDHGKVLRDIKKIYSGASTRVPISYPRPKIGSTVFAKIRKWVLTQKCHFFMTPKKVPILAKFGPILNLRHDIESEGLSFLCQI